MAEYFQGTSRGRGLGWGGGGEGELRVKPKVSHEGLKKKRLKKNSRRSLETSEGQACDRGIGRVSCGPRRTPRLMEGRSSLGAGLAPSSHDVVEMAQALGGGLD